MNAKRLTPLFVFLAVAAAALACNVGNPGAGNGSGATVQAVYSTITAQAERSTQVSETQAADGSEGETTATPDAATATWTPSPSPTPPEHRSGNGANLSLARCKLEIVIDGNDNDWTDQPENITAVSLNANTFGASEWTGSSDLSGEASICWTFDTLFLLVEAEDDVFVQTEQGRTQWLGDEIEILFDAELYEDFYEDTWDADDTQLGISPGNFNDIPPGAVRYAPTYTNETGVRVAAKRPLESGGDYLIEAAIPWSLLGVTPAAEAKYGLCIALTDNDHVNEASQDSMVSHCLNLSVPDPTTWTSVELMQ